MPDNRPGMWMYHRHILEHHEAGMMANFEVTDERNFNNANTRYQSANHDIHHEHHH